MAFLFFCFFVFFFKNIFYKIHEAHSIQCPLGGEKEEKQAIGEMRLYKTLSRGETNIYNYVCIFSESPDEIGFKS